MRPLLKKPLRLAVTVLLLPTASTFNNVVDVAIVGGGPCGLATAIALSKAPCLQGRVVAVFEKDQYQPKGASIQISDAGWSALKAIDSLATSRIRATSTPVTNVQLRSFAGADLAWPLTLLSQPIRPLFDALSVFGVRDNLPGTHLWHDVRTVLRNRVRERLGDDALRNGHELQNVSEEPDAITLRFAVSDGKETSVRARLVLACDGTRSTVRALSPEPRDVLLDEGKSVWRGVSPTVDPQGCATFYRGDSDESALIFPAGLKQGASWTVIAPVVAGRSSTPEQARARLRGALPANTDRALLEVIAKSESIIENKLVTRNFNKPWTSAVSRIAYLGDASHPLRPTGEGTALAFEDAFVLGALVRRSRTLQPATLRAFEKARKERVRAISDAVKRSANQFYDRNLMQKPQVPGPIAVAAAMSAHPMKYMPL